MIQAGAGVPPPPSAKIENLQLPHKHLRRKTKDMYCLRFLFTITSKCCANLKTKPPPLKIHEKYAKLQKVDNQSILQHAL
jgi:hypothetical protein